VVQLVILLRKETTILDNYFSSEFVNQLLNRIDNLTAVGTSLTEQIAIQNETIFKLNGTITALSEENALLKERLNKNSKNSSKPPSTDGFDKPKPKSLRKPSGKKQGAQIGHKGNGFSLLSEPDELVLHKPNACNGCLNVDNCKSCSASENKYVVDIKVATNVVAHNTISYSCPKLNGAIISGSFPSNVTSTMQYGDNLEALAIALNTSGMMSLKRTHEILSAVFGIPISAGTVFQMVKDCGAKLIATVDHIREVVTSLPLVHFDETGLRVDKKLHWVHSASNDLYTYLSIETKRGQVGMDASGVLPGFAGIAIHDFWKPYWGYAGVTHAVCNAHLLRELTGITDNHPDQIWANAMIKLLLRMKKICDRFVAQGKACLSYYYHHCFQMEYDNIIEQARRMNPIEDKPVGKRGRQKKGKIRALIERFVEYKESVCLFTKNFKVPFDNNQAERDIRMIKVKQKVSGCFRTKEGADTFATIMSYLGTATKHDINSYVAIKSALAGQSEKLIFA